MPKYHFDACLTFEAKDDLDAVLKLAEHFTSVLLGIEEGKLYITEDSKGMQLHEVAEQTQVDPAQLAQNMKLN